MTQATTTKGLTVRALLVLGLLPAGAPACARTVSNETRRPPEPAPEGPRPVDADGGPRAATVPDAQAAPAPSPDRPWSPPDRIDGPHEDLVLEPGRPIFYALPTGKAEPHRLVGHLHGMCGAPSYACGKWVGAGTDVGLVVCPTGNARCGDPSIGPPSWEAATWPELVAIMDHDLEAAIAKVTRKRPGAVDRGGAVLTGYSRGAYAAPVIARKHPGLWPYLVLIEAHVPLTSASLAASGVRAVALVAGEQGTEIAGMRKTIGDLERSGYRAKLFVMPRTGHLYSADMELVMHEALTFVLSDPTPP